MVCIIGIFFVTLDFHTRRCLWYSSLAVMRLRMGFGGDVMLEMTFGFWK